MLTRTSPRAARQALRVGLAGFTLMGVVMAPSSGHAAPPEAMQDVRQASFDATQVIDPESGQTAYAAVLAARLRSGEANLHIRICDEAGVCTDYSKLVDESEFFMLVGGAFIRTMVPGLGDVDLEVSVTTDRWAGIDFAWGDHTQTTVLMGGWLLTGAKTNSSAGSHYWDQIGPWRVILGDGRGLNAFNVVVATRWG
ncbi:MAG: hypothetical protein HY775_04920 [Acidobacteria bacterium]|nr:hypothetical protein [Acidobacteriota bacterium]